MNILNIACRLCLSIAALLVLGACQPSSQQSSNVEFGAPQTIVQTRAINRDLLEPIVRLPGGVLIPMTQTGDNQWSGSINVKPNQEYFVTIDWIEKLEEGDLILARWSSIVEVGANGKAISLTDTDYDYSHDLDGDNITNLDERRNNTNPFVKNDMSSSTDGGQNENSTNNNDNNEPEPTDSNQPNNETAGSDDNEPNTTDDPNNSDNNDGFDNSTDPADNPDNTNNNSAPLSKASVLITRIDPNDAPDIDGDGVDIDEQGNLKGEWAAAVQSDDSGAGLWIKNLMIDDGADSADGAELRRWAAMHDGEFLYVLVLSDDIGTPTSDSTNIWQDDSLELFIDADNSKNSSYGDADDFHFLLALQKQNSTNSKAGNDELSGRYSIGPFSSDAPLAIQFSTGPGQGPDGIRAANWEQDVYEIAVPIEQAGIVIGSPFGFELQINDDDDGGLRDSKWGWFHRSKGADEEFVDDTYLNPSVMGTVLLQQ